MTADWQTTLKELQQLDEVGDGPLGYWGLSMGTMFGVPFVAATPEVGRGPRADGRRRRGTRRQRPR